MVATIAISPVKGKSPHGCSFKHGFVNLSNASGSTCIKPVANMTPAANALIIKKPSFSGLKAGTTLPMKGIHTPSAPATRMEASAMSLYWRASFFLPSFSSGSQGHLAKTWVVIMSKNKKETKASFPMPILIIVVEALLKHQQFCFFFSFSEENKSFGYLIWNPFFSYIE
ncbi:hypothetical protein HanRHA438_Chr04g0195321 [Helianthus annuus]|nr:hypothetical protein HanRHA438_Chr04g0195321 [Helianthus annuus]